MGPARRALGNRSLEEINATHKKDGNALCNVLIAGLLRPVIGEQLRSDHGGGGLS